MNKEKINALARKYKDPEDFILAAATVSNNIEEHKSKNNKRNNHANRKNY